MHLTHQSIASMLMLVVYFNLFAFGSDLNDAIKTASEAIDLDPKSFELRIHRGNLYSTKMEYQKSLADFEEAVRIKPTNAGAYTSRGMAYIYNGKIDLAMKDFDESIRLEPKSALMYINRAFAWTIQNQWDKAIRDYDAAIKFDPDQIATYWLRGFACAANGDWILALCDYDHVIVLKPTDPMGEDAYIRSLSCKALILASCPDETFRDSKRAFDDALVAYNHSRGRIECLISLAAAYAEAGQFDDAIKLINRVVDRPTTTIKLNNELKEYLKLYELRKPYRLPAKKEK